MPPSGLTHTEAGNPQVRFEKKQIFLQEIFFFFCLLTTSDSWCCACLRWRSSCRQTYTDIWKCSHSGSRQSDHLALNLENGESSFYREVKWIQRAGNNTHYLPSGQTQDLMRFWREWLGLKLEQLGTKAAPCSSYTRSPGQVGAAGTGVQKIVIGHKMCFTKFTNTKFRDKSIKGHQPQPVRVLQIIQM